MGLKNIVSKLFAAAVIGTTLFTASPANPATANLKFKQESMWKAPVKASEHPTCRKTIRTFLAKQQPLTRKVRTNFPHTQEKKVEKNSSDGLYDNHNFYAADSLEEITNSVHKIISKHYYDVTEFVYEKTMHGYKLKTENGEPVTKKSETELEFYGSAIEVYRNKFRSLYLTCNHIMDQPGEIVKYLKDNKGNDILDKNNQKLVWKVGRFKKSESQLHLASFFGLNLGSPLRQYAHDKNLDIALLSCKPIAETNFFGTTNKFIACPYRWGDSDKLEPGDFLYIVGYPNNICKITSHGIVASSKGNPFSAFDNNIFYTDATIDPGNSGSPVFAIKDGSYEFVGIAKLLFANKYGGIIKINRIKEFLDSYKLGFIYNRK